MILFIDTETTGLPANYKAPSSDTDNWPRMVELAMILAEDEDNYIERSPIIIPEGYTIPDEASNLHGITTEKATEEGEPLRNVLEELSTYASMCTYLVAHNISFDSKIIGAEYHRKNIPLPRGYIKICTKEMSTDYCNIPGQYGRAKWPKLQELHERLFGCSFDGAHGALADTRATMRCFWKLVNMQVIDLNKVKMRYL